MRIMSTNSIVLQTESFCDIHDIKEAKSYIRPYVRHTPLIQSMFLSNNVTGGNVFLKLENMQFTGSFKFRGALNKILHLTDEQKEKGIITASAGNHAQGLALTGKLLDIKTTVIMPNEAPIAKQEATRGYGAEVILEGDTFNDSRLYMEQMAKETGKTIVHPYDDSEVMAGQGTIGLEILDSIWNVDTVVLPVGGGGLISGVATALKFFNPNIHIIGVQSENVHGMATSIEAGRITSQFTDHTIADGTEVAIPGDKTFEVVDKLVDEFILVSEEEISSAMRHLMQRTKIVTEGAGALPTAALISGKIDPCYLKDKNIVALVSGGNVDLTRVSDIIDHLLKPADTSEGVVG